VPVTLTLGSALNLLYLALFVVSLPALMWLRRPRGDRVTPMASLAEADDAPATSVAAEAAALALDGTSPADRLNNGRPLQLLLALAAAWVVVRHVARNGFDLDLNLMIFAFMALGLLAHGTPMRYAVAMKRACANISGIVFQYPFYAGIMGIAMFSGLGAQVAEALAAHATLTSLPLLAQVAGALVNFAIPSAGGEWTVIGPALTSAALELSAALPPDEATAYVARIAMSVAYGETSTNLLQPFFLLTVLPVMGAGMRIQARDVLGHLVVPFVWIYAATAVLLVLAP
jgi:short-chain fatty acids transporter